MKNYLVINGNTIPLPDELVKQTEKPLEKFTYRVGQYFVERSHVGKFILAQVLDSEVCLISLDDGNRWADPIEVKDIINITEEELKKCSGESGHFHLN